MGAGGMRCWKGTAPQFSLVEIGGPQFHRPRRRRFPAWNPQPRVQGRGGQAMWIIMYVAVMASLRAMGLAPGLVPIRAGDGRRPPFGDIGVADSRFWSRRVG